MRNGFLCLVIGLAVAGFTIGYQRSHDLAYGYELLFSVPGGFGVGTAISGVMLLARAFRSDRTPSSHEG